MRAVTRARTAAVTTVVAALSATAFSGATQAQAGPNAWTQLSSGGMLRNIDEPAVARVGTKLQAVWQEEGPTRRHRCDPVR